VALGGTISFTLVLSPTSGLTESLGLHVVDPNPDPAVLRFITSSISGDGVYSEALGGVLWDLTLEPAVSEPVTLSFEMAVTDTLGQPLESATVLTNSASVTDLATGGTEVNQMASAGVRIVPRLAFLPLVRRTGLCGDDFVYTCGIDVPSPFSIEIAALHQVTGGGALALGVPAVTKAEVLAWYEDAFPTLVDALEDSGAGWSRVYIDWSQIQPDEPPAPYVWESFYDEKLEAVAETGVHTLAVVSGSPEWAADSENGPINRLDDFEVFLTDLVNRYRVPPYNIKHWELINEPDNTDPAAAPSTGAGAWGHDGDRYAAMLAVAHPAIKAADPEATVLMGGVAYDWFLEYGGPFNRYFPDDVMAAGGGEFIDAINFHYFTPFHPEWERWVPEGIPPTCGDVEDGQGLPYDAWGIDLIAKTNHYRNRMSTCFGVVKPVWVTELAEHGYADSPTSLATQARYVVQGYARGLSAGVQNITWFALVTPLHDYGQGLLFEDWSPKPAFYAYRTMTEQLSGHLFSSALYVPGGEAYVFATPCGQETTVVWGSGVLEFAPAYRARIVDRENNMKCIADGGADDADGTPNGAIGLQLSAEPVFVRLR
jgi:hypothetical protein